MDCEYYDCPLLKKKIDDSYCYEIRMVISGIIKPAALPDYIDKTQKKICENCEHYQN